MAKKLYSFDEHPEHREQLKPCADKWIANAMSTKPMDDAEKALCVEAVYGLYESAGLPRPKHVVFVPSPLVAALAGSFASAIWWLSRREWKIPSGKRATRAATAAATDAATRDATDAATDAATYDATRAATRDATDAATDAATYDATDAATHAATYDATDAATHAATDAARKPGPLSEYARFLLLCCGYWYKMRSGGNQWSAWASYLSFFRHVAKLDLPIYDKWQHWETLALHSGPRMEHADFCIISDRPEILTVDDRNRPHGENGPSHRWRDGWSLYYWHGVRVPEFVVMRPDLITVEHVAREENSEVQRVMLERFGGAERPEWGLANYIAASGAKRLSMDDYGELYRIELGTEPMLIVIVTNGTREADGSYKRYALRVHPELRPMRLRPGDDPELGEPQAMTARNAVASTYGLRGEDYQVAVRT